MVIDRLVLFLKGTGCSLATETGGCTFCGFYNVTNFGVRIHHKEYIEQIENVLNNKKINLNKFPVICIYNDGSLLNDEEIKLDTIINIIHILNEKDGVKKITIESKIEDITEEKLAMIRAVTNKEFEKKCELARNYNIDIVPLLLFKPPFLTEYEAIEDYVNSLEYLDKFGFKRIDMEILTVERYTLIFDLWKHNMYTPPKLWSVIEVLKKREEKELKTQLYISPPSYSVPLEAKASNCDKCNTVINNAIENFNINGNILELTNIKCLCKEEWLSLLVQSDIDEDLLRRVNDTLKKLNEKERSKFSLN